ncbi:V-set and transmembrane domain-containing protein 4a [Alosa pseudoharengus]|uniref:V-set and transmembrane domain-containing protein 4a n=1 Tax=Alosa pseudoharengus TaxID=34774 RepID=UPI003F8CE143
MLLYWLLIVLTKSLSSVSLNVTVTPGPVLVCVEGESVELGCVVGGRRGKSSVVVLRWVVQPHLHDDGHHATDHDGNHTRAEEEDEFLLVKLNVRGAEFWGNYTQRSGRPTLYKLRHDNPGHAYSLLLSNVTRAQGGRYSCRVQEVRKQRNRWRAVANGTAHTLLRVHDVADTNRVVSIWRLFQDLYLCAALLCCVGLVSMFLFAIVMCCQQITRPPRPKDSYSLVKCPDSSSGETVTSEMSAGSTEGSKGGMKRAVNGGIRSPVNPGGSDPSARPHRKQKRHKHHPPDPLDAPPLVPAKAPRKPRRTKLLKAQPRRTAVVVDDSLTYAELELVKAKPLPQPEPTADSSGTVYAQILFP